MQDTWNLDPLYKGFDDEAYRTDVSKLSATAQDLIAFADTVSDRNPQENLIRGMELTERMAVLQDRLVNFALLRLNINSANTQAGSELEQVLRITGNTAAAQAAFNRWLCALPDLPERIASEDSLKDYAFYFQKLTAFSPYLLPGNGERIVSKMQLSGGSAWADLQQHLTSSLTVDYRGEKKTLSQIRNLASDPDPLVRKDAFDAELAAYPKIADSIAYALNSIKLENLSECELRGHESPLAWTLKESQMQRKTLDAMLEAMDEYLPCFHKYLKTKAKALGHEQGLPWYDLFAPMGASSTKFTPESAGDYLVELFSTFDPELANMIRTAFDNRWIDFYPRPGKSGGAFCAEVQAIGESRILTNFDGSFSSVVTLAHELGHAYHNHCIRDHRPLNHDYSMPLAETASTFNECVVMASAIEKAADDLERIALIESQLQDATQIICDIYSRYRFEAEVYERRSTEFMNADTFCDIMLRAQKQCYGDGLDHDKLHPYMWICKSHYYGPMFYNFPYAFGGLFARGLYALYQQQGAAFTDRYKKLLYTTCIASAEDTAQTAGIDLTDKNFWRGALQTIADQIDLLCGLLENTTGGTL